MLMKREKISWGTQFIRLCGAQYGSGSMWSDRTIVEFPPYS